MVDNIIRTYIEIGFIPAAYSIVALHSERKKLMAINYSNASDCFNSLDSLR